MLRISLADCRSPKNGSASVSCGKDSVRIIVRETAAFGKWDYPRELRKRQCENIARKTEAFGGWEFSP